MLQHDWLLSVDTMQLTYAVTMETVMSDNVATILIVDDVRTNIQILADILASDYQIRTAMSGPEGLQIAKEQGPDLILLDVVMPDMDGFEVLRRLRRIDSLAEVPVIFVTALEGSADESFGLRLGAADYLTRPCNPEIVRLRVRNTLELARRRSELKKQKEQLERQNGELKAALDRIQRLEGSAPGSPSPVGLPQMEHEQRFHILCDSAPVGIFLADSQGSNLYSNPRLGEIIGQTAAEDLGQGWGRAIHPDDRAEALRFWGELVAAGRPGSHESRLQNAKGETSRIRVLVNPIKDGSGLVTGYAGTVEDITSQSQALEEMIKIQKLESVGLLAGGIAHDFNNILTGILGNISLAQMCVEPSSMAFGPLKEMEKASERAVELTRQLLTFATGGDPVKKAVSIEHLLNESVSIALRGSNVQGVVEISGSVRGVEVDEGQMLQALSNIVINAAQAMPEGGRLTVEAGDVQLGKPNRLGLPAGEYVKISISDEGRGKPDSSLGKIFDPYFTTKQSSTGLGLASTTYSIVAKHGGHVSAQSLPGQGVVFTLHLPSCARVAKESGAALPAAATQHRGGAILVMDDDQIIRTIATQMLECLGYQVTVCENGSEAIALYQAVQAAGRPFEAVIMDLTVAGGMGGEEAARRILAIDPGARLIVSSGYNNDRVMAEYRKFGFCSVIPKPYRTADLSAVLSKVFQDKAR